MAHLLVFGSLCSSQISSTIGISALWFIPKLPHFSFLCGQLTHYCLVHLELGMCQREMHSSWKPCVFSRQNTNESPLITWVFSCTLHPPFLWQYIFFPAHSSIFLFHIIMSFSISIPLQVQVPANRPSSCFWAALTFYKGGDYIMCPFHHATYFLDCHQNEKKKSHIQLSDPWGHVLWSRFLKTLPLTTWFGLK